MNSDIMLVSAFTIVGIFIIVLLRNLNSEYAVPVSILVGIFVFVHGLPMIAKLFDFSDGLITNVISDSDLKVLYKAIGTSFLVQYVVEFSKENGLDSISSRVEFLGKIYILTLGIPILESIISSISVN